MSDQENDLPRGLSQPSLRALASVGIHRLDQLTTITAAELSKLRGFGPKALDVLRKALAEQGLAFAGE